MICYLCRHGQDDNTVRGGWSQHPLTAKGKAEAKELAFFLEKKECNIRHVYSSDLLRSVQTAQAVAARLDLPIIYMPEFREVNNGILAGMKNELANQQYPGLYWNSLAWEQPYPNGESPKSFFERISTAWDRFQEEIIQKNENVLLVTHGGVIQVILSLVNGVAYSNQAHHRKIANTELIALKYNNGAWKEVSCH